MDFKSKINTNLTLPSDLSRDMIYDLKSNSQLTTLYQEVKYNVFIETLYLNITARLLFSKEVYLDEYFMKSRIAPILQLNNACARDLMIQQIKQLNSNFEEDLLNLAYINQYTSKPLSDTNKDDIENIIVVLKSKGFQVDKYHLCSL